MVLRIAFACAFAVVVIAVISGAGGDPLAGILALIGIGGIWVLRHRLEQSRAHALGEDGR